jgi:dienelactone hydrolase
MSAMNEQQIAFSSRGRTLGGVLVEPTAQHTSPRPGVLVLHGGSGLGQHERERAGMLAELGYVAFAPDLFGEVFTSREHGIATITNLVADPPKLRARLADALEWLRASSRVDPERLAAIGFCFGGLAALELARGAADLRAVVSFHGGLTTRMPAVPGAVKAAVLVCTGAADPFVPREHRNAFEDEMTHANVDWQLHVYANAMHGFTEGKLAGPRLQRPGSLYHEPSDRRSWATMRALLEARFT